MWSWRSLDALPHRLPFDDGFCLPFGIPSKKGEYFVEFCLSVGEYFDWLELVEYRLCASHCILFFLALPMFFDGIFMFGGVFFFFLLPYLFLVSNCLLIYIYEVFIDICLSCVLFEIKNLICVLVFSPHMRLCILFSFSGNIQVDSIELLSTLTTDG